MSTLFIFTCYNTNCLICGKFRPAAAAETYAKSALIGPLKIPYKGFTRLYLEVYFYVHELFFIMYQATARIYQTGYVRLETRKQPSEPNFIALFASVCVYIATIPTFLSFFSFFSYLSLSLFLILFYFLTISELRCQWVLLIQTLNPFANNSTSYIENELKEPIARPMS